MSTPTSKGPWEDTDIDPLILQAMRGLPADFADFPRIFQDDLLPSLQAQEAERRTAATASVRWSWIGFGVGVLGALLFLTFVTVAVTWVDLGPFNIIVAMEVAAVKASLVLLYFMHLRWDRPFNAIVLIVSIALVALFIVFALLDAFAYQPEIIQDFAPQLQQ